MSDVGKLKRYGQSKFPSVRKSSDPLTPEMGEINFSEEVAEFDALYSTSVQEPEKTEQTIINEENRRRQFRFRKKNPKKEEKKVENEDNLVDLQA